MRAARLHEGETTLKIEDLPDPAPPPGCALVELHSVFLSPYMADLIDGSGGFSTPARPFTPGMDAIGKVVEINGPAAALALGDLVFCDSYIEEPSAGGGGEFAFAGCFPISDGAQALLDRWPHGALATHMVLPAENLTPVSPALSSASADALCRIGWLGTGLAALEKGGFRAGCRVAVLGATGLLGAGTVLLALAMGASQVYAIGRSPEKLAALEQLDSRVAGLTGAPPPDAGVDVAVNLTPFGNADLLEGTMQSLKRYGALVLVNGVGGPMSLPGLMVKDLTVRGSMWFPRDTPARLVEMIGAGALSLERVHSHSYPLDRVNDAVAHGAQSLPPFEQVVVNPQA